jgi:hypothetical protein
LFLVVITFALLLALPLSAVAASNTAPDVTITSPADNASFLKGAVVKLSATASDAQDGVLSSRITWKSSINGTTSQKGGSISTSNLSVGTHIITAAVTDSGGLSGSDKITITVKSSTTASTATTATAAAAPVINTVTANKTSPQTAPVTIRWTCDADGPTGLQYAWYVYKDGAKVYTKWYSTSKYFDYGISGAGTYKVLAFAMAPDGSKTSKYSNDIVVNAATVAPAPTVGTTGVTCSSLGMIPNDKTKGLSNYNLLIAAAMKGTKINVNGVYYLTSPYSGGTSKNLVTAGLYLSGSTPAASKLILQGGDYFSVKGQALIENVSIECPTSTTTTFIRMVAPFINSATIRNNYITGNIRLIVTNIPDGYNFNGTPCYIENLTVENNEFYDVYNTVGPRSIIYAIDTPVKACYIRNNKITNFSYMFYYNGITNGHPSSDYLYKNINAVIENNKVVCTDSYNAVSKNNGYLPAYYCFALIEGRSVTCRGNTFEGFHVSNAPNTVVYDNYFSVTKLLYEKNTWKNIVNFTAGIENVDIMKAKTAYKIAGEKRERIYRGNTFIVEPGYADKFGKDRFMLRKEINTFTSELDRVIIEDNYFDMYILSFNYWGQKMIRESYVFSRNTVLMDTIEHSELPQAMVYIPEVKDASGSYITRSAVFTNNTITYGSKPFGKGIGDVKYYLIRNSAGCGDKTTVTFSSNNINVPDYVFSSSSIEEARGCSTIVNFLSNIINGKSV